VTTLASEEGGGEETPSTGDPPAVELDGVAKAYGETAAVENCSLAVERGEFFTLVGPSGCGKTTTLRLLAGFEAPTRGTVRIDGDDVAGVPPEDRDVGVVFQNYALFPHMTVAENVGYGLQFADPPGDVGREERVRELLELVDLAGFGDRDPDSLSGGQAQRVAMARALAPGPDVLLLDEPMSALDARLRERLRVQVREIQRELGITTVYVTHDQEEALAVSDRVAVMRAGTPEQVGPPREVYRRPATRFVAEFVGDNNVLEGTVRSVTGGVAEVAVEGADERLAVAADGTVPATGDAVTVCVRPERLSVGGERRTELPATVRSSEFLGESTRVRCEWADRELLVRTADPLAGDVTLGFDPDDAHVVAVRDGGRG
jgi:thiamine transport system ATP-binding protein